VGFVAVESKFKNLQISRSSGAGGIRGAAARPPAISLELLSPLFGLIDADLDVGRAPTLGLDEEGEDEDEAAPTALAWSRMDFASALAVGDTLDISFFHLLASSGFTSM